MASVLGLSAWPAEGSTIAVRGLPMILSRGILRAQAPASDRQRQTELTFGFKWKQRSTFEGESTRTAIRAWLVERYGSVAEADWLKEAPQPPLLVDAGCGAALSALELFGDALGRVRYLGVDISEAVDVAAARFAERNLSAGFLQTDVNRIPLPPGSVDVVFAEGVLHHTDSTEQSFMALAALLKPGGRFLFYVYRKKGPIREFTDDFIRNRLQDMTPEQAWKALEPLTKFGRSLGGLDVDIEVPEPIDLLQIPAGKSPLQRFLYWHVFKAYYRPDMTLEEMNHVNFDWYAPRNAHRQTVEDVRQWCAASRLSIERERVEEAGITVMARKEGR
jgi:SAM-dependent methyltransferase